MSAAVDARFDLSRIGERLESEKIAITEEATRRFAAATNDANPDLVAGRLAPPVYAVVPVLPTMVAAKNAVSTAFAFHGEHDLVVHEPLRPGMVVRAAATVVGVHQRSAGVATVVHVETLTDDGPLANEQWFTSFVAGASIDESRGKEAPATDAPPPAGEPAEEVVLPLDPDQTRRFAEASDDWDAYTIDEDAARALGFPTVIVHGTCTMAFAGRAVVQAACGGDVRKLRRLALRLSRPLTLIPGQTLTTRIRYVGARHGSEGFTFEATDLKGDLVIKNGWAEVAP